MSRTKNSIRNIIFGFINKIVMLFFPFVLRTIMIKTLGSEFLGLNSLISSILHVLNLAELGVGSAIVYSMYAPIANKDNRLMCSLLNLYKKIYRYIGMVILFIGIIILPFLKYFINGGYPDSINIYIVFLLYLFNTSLSYFLFAYKNSLLVASQRNDISNNILTICSLFQYILQIIILLKVKDYYLFIIINILATIINNILISIIVNKKYPQYKCTGNISLNMQKEIKKRTSGLLIQKICGITRNSFDSIFISAFLGLNVVAIYTNYYTIISALISLFGVFSTSILSSVGNSIVTESEEKNYNDMRKINYIYMILSGMATIGLLCLYQPFMEIWMGKDMMLPFNMIALLCIYFYFLKMGDIRMVYSDAKGLWWENKYRAIIEVILNITLNYCLGKFWGLYGIIAATIISIFFINFIWSSQILFKYYFKNFSVANYYRDNIIYFIVTVSVAALTYVVVDMIPIKGIAGLLTKAFVCLTTSTLGYLLFYFKSNKFKESLNFSKKIFLLHILKRKEV